MSHSKERKEKNCLNCGAEVAGRFCQVCGQENSITKESFAHLVTHFFNDITHFDGKFFNSARYLVTRPGKLTYEYTSGRRMRYLNPIRMYVFTSAFFFLIFFSFISKKYNGKKEGLEGLKEELVVKQDQLQKFQQMATLTADPVMLKAVNVNIVRREKDIAILSDSISKHNGGKKSSEELKEVITPSIPGIVDSVRVALDSVEQAQKTDTTIKNQVRLNDREFLDFDFYKDEATYNAIQKELPNGKRDGFFESVLKLRLLHWHNQQKKNGVAGFHELLDRFKHTFPTILFISLPIFAFLLKLLYVRRKQFYYADHGIFAIHTYCALFILMLFYYLVDALDIKWNGWGWGLLKTGLIIYMFIYVYKAMRFYYGQGRLKTLFKYGTLSFLTLITMIFLIATFFLVTAIKN